MISIDFEPSSYYLYEQMKFLHKSQTKSDRLNAFLKHKHQWESNSFISNNHVKHSDQSREGRKLNLAEYNRRTQPKSLKK